MLPDDCKQHGLCAKAVESQRSKTMQRHLQQMHL